MRNLTTLVLAVHIACADQDVQGTPSGSPDPDPCTAATSDTGASSPEPATDSCPTFTYPYARWDEGWIMVQPGEPCPDMPATLRTLDGSLSNWRGEICAFLRVERDRVLVEYPVWGYCWSGGFHDAACLEPDLVDDISEGPGQCVYLALFDPYGTR